MWSRDRLGAAVRTLQYTLRYVVNVHPWLYMPLARRWHCDNRDRLVERDTELVIEAFGRSGSTFAVLTFEMAQPRHVKTAHHSHAAAQVIVAARWQIPTLVIVRRPMDSALSHMVRRRIPARPALKSWIRFHEHILPYRDRLLVTTLESVSTDFGLVTRAINQRFGTDFKELEHTQENQARISEMIEVANLKKYGQATDWVARPTPERLERKNARRAELDDPHLANLRKRADQIYRILVPAGGP